MMAADPVFPGRLYRSILCLNGTLPDAAFFAFFADGLPVIAADGAALSLQALGICPDWVIGDFDSGGETVHGKNRIHCPDQNSCDFEKCLVFMRENSLLPAVITGVQGGSLDHVLNNISIFLQSDCMLYAPPVTGHVLKSGKYFFSKPVNTKLSLLGFPESCVSSDGLKWELHQYKLAFPGKNSCFNRNIQETVHLEVHSGRVLLLVYQQPVWDKGVADRDPSLG